MPKQQGLLRRGSRYFANIRVPKDLRAVVGKEHVRVALGTSDHREAARLVAFERVRWLALFEEKRLASSAMRFTPAASSAPVRKVLALTETEAFEWTCRHLIARERGFREWFEKDGRQLDSDTRERVVENIGIEADALSGAGVYAPEDGRQALKKFLQANGLECPEDSPAFRSLLPLFRRAEMEHAQRRLDEMSGKPAVPRDAAFREVFAHSPPPAVKAEASLAELVQRYTAFQQAAKRSPATIRAYQLPCRLLREYFGDAAPLSSLTGDALESFCGDLQRYPINAAQRYPGLNVRQAIAAADAASDARRLNARTLANYFELISSLFRFAVEKKLMPENPLNDRYSREKYGTRPDKKPKEQFTIPEMNRLFRAPLYAGCVNDGHGYATPGHEHPRRGRFWVPLLGLFHGLRLNEACQLHVADVQERDGIPFLSITETGENGEATEKRLKTKQSRREVPIHPVLQRIGFLDFARQRKDAGDSPRLFPELPQGSKGGFSEIFSKWFIRFVKGTLGDACGATFHSFRHAFRDAARVARMPLEVVERLAGWEGGKSASGGMAAHYGGGPAFFRVLAEEIAKIEFPGLDLSHLEPEKPVRVKDTPGEKCQFRLISEKNTDLT